MARAGVMTLKEELTAAQTRITELETAAASHATVIAERDTKISGLETKVTELTGTVATHVATIAERDAKITEISATVATHVATITERDAKIVELNGKITTVDLAADVKAREIAARHGVTLPPKAAEAGNKETENADANGTPTEKLAALFEPKA